MSSIITSILSSTVGLLWNKVRDTTAEKLKDGDVTDAKIREIVVRDLNDVKTKLDGLSRRDLLSSYHFLKEGVDLLNVALDKTMPKAKDEENRSLNEAQGGGGEASGMSSSVERDILNDALELSDAMRKVKIESDKELEVAEERFREARVSATHAFCNEALSIEDRIFAAKLRVVSEILECLESPKTAIAGCLSFLRELHSLPAIQNMFSVFLNGGFKSLLNKAERVENVKSVMLINYAFFRFVLKFSNEYLSHGLVWPRIKVVDGSFNPILEWRKVSSRIAIGEGLFQPPNVLEHFGGFRRRRFLRRSAVNSHGEILVACTDQIEIISKTKEPKVVRLPDPGENESKNIEAFAVDESNNVYVLRLLRKRTENNDAIKSYVLYILDENYQVQRCSAFNFEAVDEEAEIRIAVNKNNDIIMNKADDPHVYVCDNSGHLKHKFERDSSRARNMSISTNNEIMIPASDPRAVHIYTEEGMLKSTIKVPEGHNICNATFSYFIPKIIILTFNREAFSYSLLVYSETGELESSIFVSNPKLPPSLVSHPSGPVAIIKFGTITYI